MWPLPAPIWAIALRFILLPSSMPKLTVSGVQCLFVVPSSYSLSDIDPSVLAPRLWGDIYFNKASNKFTRKAQDASDPRAFVQFVLEPLYKLYSSVLSKESGDLQATLATLGIKLKPVMYKMDVRPLLKAVLDQFFGPSTGLVDMIVEHIPSPVAGAASKVRQLLTTLHYFLMWH